MIHSVPAAYRSPGGRYYEPFLSLATRPHLLIAGATGSGKSVALNGILATILMLRSPFQCKFVLIDPKKVELIQYADLPHTVRYASETADIIRALQWACDETERRFSAMQTDRIREYSGSDLYIIIDELADLIMSAKSETLPLLQRLTAIGRAAKVHVIACSQNIMAQTIPTVIRCNIPTVLGLRTATTQQSRFLISAPGCEKLPDPKAEGKGYGYIRDGADLSRIAVYKYPDSVLDNLISWWTSSACRVEKGA